MLSPQGHPCQVWLGDCTGSSSASSVLPRLQLHTHLRQLCLIATFCHSWGLFCFCRPTPFALMTFYNIILFVPQHGTVAEHYIFPSHIFPTLFFLVSCPTSSQTPGIMAAVWNAGHMVCHGATESVSVSHSHGLPNSVHTYQNKWNCGEEGISFFTPEKG